jgi:YVTN family beta-propeller protein
MTSHIRAFKGVSFVFVLALGVIESSCGDVYRPVAQVVPGTPPDPAAIHFIVAVSTNGNDALVSGVCQPSGTPPPCISNIGSASRLDVSGDTNLGVLQTGLVPIHAALLQNASRQYIANYGDDTVTENAPSSPTVTSTISLAPGAKPVFVHTSENSNVYVANSGNNTVSVINAASNVVTTNVPVGPNPIALAEMPNSGSTNQKLYVASRGSNSLTVINVVDDSVGAPVPIGAPQVWAVARPDSRRIYVLDSTGTISTIDTLTDSVLANSASPSAGAGANFMFLDSKAQRLYVTNPNPAFHRLSIFDISEVNPSAPVNPVASLDLGQSVAGSFYLPVSVTGIGDGSRAYVATYQLTTCGPVSAPFPCINTSVAVINVSSNTVSKFVPIASAVPVDATNSDGCGGTASPNATPWTPGSARFRLSAAASGGGTTSNFKVYVAQCDAQNVAVIDTFPANSNPTDTFAGVTIPTPLSAFPGQQVSISGATQTAATSTTPATTTYAYTQSSGTGLQIGMRIFITGMTDTGNNGNFVISALGSGTFTVGNPSGVTASSQSGTGAVLPRQNPVFLVAGP